MGSINFQSVVSTLLVLCTKSIEGTTAGTFIGKSINELLWHKFGSLDLTKKYYLEWGKLCIFEVVYIQLLGLIFICKGWFTHWNTKCNMVGCIVHVCLLGGLWIYFPWKRKGFMVALHAASDKALQIQSKKAELNKFLEKI